VASTVEVCKVWDATLHARSLFAPSLLDLTGVSSAQAPASSMVAEMRTWSPRIRLDMPVLQDLIESTVLGLQQS
jgi:hypothetical protein